jgi:hypothetical protein
MTQQPLVNQGVVIIQASRPRPIIHTKLRRTSLDEWSARRRDLYLTKHNTRKRQTSMRPAVFETAILEREGPQTHALDRAATEIDITKLRCI